MSYMGYQITKDDDNFTGQWTELDLLDLPEGEVLIEVHYSSVNYKDALSAAGNKGVTKHYPHTPGIDAAGVVLKSSVSQWVEGDEVIVFGYDLGMNTAGGFSQRIKVPASWVLRVPRRFSLADSMAWGTAGFTAALSLLKLERAGLKPERGPVAVTGACGGVGSMAVALLSAQGYDVTAITGKDTQVDWLKSLGANQVMKRDELMSHMNRPINKARFQGAVDTCGGDVLSALLSMTQNEGAVSTCGMVAGHTFTSSVFPFILRGVSLLGVDSVEIDSDQKQAILDKIAREWALPNLNELVKDIGIDELASTLELLQSAQAVGRYRLTIPR